MTGEYPHSFDTKGRIFIPSKLRDELGSVFYVTISAEECLNGYPEESWRQMSEKVSAMPFNKQRKMRPLFANASKCELDGQGRVLIPQNLREFAHLDKNVVIVGDNNHIEFWDSEKWADVKEIETKPENLMSVMEELDF